jgi:hypothetical protein
MEIDHSKKQRRKNQAAALAARLSMALFENPVIQTEEEKEAYSLFLLLSSDDSAIKQENKVLQQKVSLLESLRAQLIKQSHSV